MASFGEVYGTTDWNCASSTNTGTFTRSNDCTISGNNHVAVANTLEIVGSNEDMNNLITITASSKHRHFYLNNANAKLILRYLKLVGGDVSSYRNSPDKSGGSICIWINGGKLNLYSSIVYNNKAAIAGGIYAWGGNDKIKIIMNIYNSIIQNNEAIIYDGAIGVKYVVGTIDNTTIDNNHAASTGGMFICISNVTMKNTTISNNKAISSTGKGGGLFIWGIWSRVILRQVSFINNVAAYEL
eukprot:g5652.t1